jgi:hypothetical protein
MSAWSSPRFMAVPTRVAVLGGARALPLACRFGAANGASDYHAAGRTERNASAAFRASGPSTASDFARQQPKRILGIMPNFRAVSAGALPPPPTPKQSFILATKNSFDYSSFIFVGLTSAIAEGTDAQPQLGKGMSGFGNYYWRGFVDKTDGNYWVIFVLPAILHQDERYFAKGEGGFWKRETYAATRIFVARNYQGDNTFNISEVLGRGIAQGISMTYYPSASNTGEKLAVKYAYALGRDAFTNVFREFWPDIATHVLHRHPNVGTITQLGGRTALGPDLPSLR